MPAPRGQGVVELAAGALPAPPWAEHLRAAVEAAAAASGRLNAPLSLVPAPLESDPEGASDGLVVAVLESVEPVLGDSPEAAAARLRLARWEQSGARLAVPAPASARVLEDALGLGRGSVIAAPLPHPSTDDLPAAAERPRPMLIAVRPPYEVFLPALRALWTLTGDRPFTWIASNDAKPYVDPGGLSQLYGLMGGSDLGAAADWRDAVDAAAVLVWFPAAHDAGWELRAALASGRPLVLPFSPVVRDHLRACGAPAYMFAGLHDPVGLTAALHVALTDPRAQRVGRCARAAVLAESWDAAAASIVGAVAPRPPRAIPRPRPRGDRLAVALVDTQGSDGGGERLLGEIVEGLCLHPSQPDVRLVCVDDPGANFSPPLERASAAGATVIAVPREAAAEASLQVIGDSDVAWMIWAQTTEPFASATPVVATIHDIAPVRFDVIGGSDPETAARIVRGWVASGATMTCSSRFIRDDIAELIPETAGRFTVIPLAAPSGDPAPSELQLAAVRARYALPPAFLLSPAPRARHKNYAVLVSALDRLRRAGRPVTVVATGSGTDLAYWGPDLIGLGYVPSADLAALRALASGVVQTSLYEAGSFPVFEAMLAGLPVACSRIPAFVEQLERDGAQAELFDPGDPDDAARALTAIWRPAPAEVRAFADNAARVARRTWVDVAGDYLEVLGSAAGRHPAPASLA